MRSLLTLKGLTYHPTGALVAALTTSLPEMPGGALNWDYRYCWLRDATFTVGALLNAGYHEEATLWRDWMLRAIAADPDKMRIMYRLDGNRRLDEATLDWLSGYEGATPVRLGNKAADQRQIDVVGELLDALALMERGGIEPTRKCGQRSATSPAIFKNVAGSRPRVVGNESPAGALHLFQSHGLGWRRSPARPL